MTPLPLSPHDAAARWRVLCAGVCALVLTLGLARFAYTPLLPIMRAQADLSLLAGGWLAAINYAGYMSGVLLATAVGDVERKFRLYRIGLLLAYALQALSALLPLLSDGVALNLASAALFGGTFVGIVSLTLALVGRHFPANPSKAMARITLGYGVAQIAAPAMGGMIARSTGSYADALAVTTVILAAGVVLLQLLIREERKTKA